MIKTKTLITVLTVLLFSAALTGQSFDKVKTDSLLNLLAEKNKAMGSLAVSENGNVIYAKAIGFREISPDKLVSDQRTKYRIGSISKMFTATLIFQLIEEGKLDLSTTLHKFYPAIANAEKITIGNMLSHRSGIHNLTNDSVYQTYMIQPKTKQEMAAIMAAMKPDFEPNAKTEYSNSNFLLLGYIVEDLHKKPYNEVLQNHICSKADLKDTYYGGKINTAHNESYSFQMIDSWEKQYETDMSIPHGAGAIVSTPSDLVKFISALFAGQLVSDGSLNQMMAIQDGLGMEMMQLPYEDKKVYGHGGAIDAFNSILCYLPEEKVAIAYCSNGTAYSINDILLRTMNNYFGKPDKLPEFKTYSVNPEDLDQYLGVYSSPQIPIKITITRKEGTLIGQGSGQPEFPLEATAKNEFKFEMAGVVMKFDPENKNFILEQGGGSFTFTRDE
jgi:CubicO group peptidase (beta-lactamase class C family)